MAVAANGEFVEFLWLGRAPRSVRLLESDSIPRTAPRVSASISSRRASVNAISAPSADESETRTKSPFHPHCEKGGGGRCRRGSRSRPAPAPYPTLGPRPRRLLQLSWRCLRFDGSLLGASDQAVMWSNAQMAHGAGNITSRFNRRSLLIPVRVPKPLRLLEQRLVLTAMSLASHRPNGQPASRHGRNGVTPTPQGGGTPKPTPSNQRPTPLIDTLPTKRRPF
jgi:hypothetical protein